MSLEPARHILLSFADAVDAELDRVRARLPADRSRVLESSATKMVATYERLIHQLNALERQLERLTTPPHGPRGPARIYSWRPRKR